MRVVKSVKKHK